MSIKSDVGNTQYPGNKHMGSTSRSRPPVTVGILTHVASGCDFALFTEGLLSAAEQYDADIELIVAINGGGYEEEVISSLSDKVRIAIEEKLKARSKTSLELTLSCKVIPNSRNNIAYGRNQILDNATYPLVAFIDDDELPDAAWLYQLVDCWEAFGVSAIAGPAVTRYSIAVPNWVISVDIHNVSGKKTGDAVEYCGCCNVLIDTSQTGDLRFDEQYGSTGGEDTDFFLRLNLQGHTIVWCGEAEVVETDDSRTRSGLYRKLARRFVKQGQIYLSIMHAHGLIKSVAAHRIRSFLVGLFSGIVALWLVLWRGSNAGFWVKRSVTNLGKCLPEVRSIYSA